MIGSVRGTVAYQAAEYCLIETDGGAGYRVFMPVSQVRTLSLGQEVRILTYTAVREDAIHLYGFLTQQYYDEELCRVIDFIKQQGIPVEYNEEVTNVDLLSERRKETMTVDESSEEVPDENGNDALLDDAIRLVLDLGQASASMLQRRFRIGFKRAARLVEVMEGLGIVGPAIDNKPRELLMSREEVEYKYLRKE